MGAATGKQLSVGRYRRRVLGWGAAALLVTFVAGSAVTLARVEDDLDRRVTAALDDAGVAGVSVSFSGQDGTLRCAAPLDHPDEVVDVGSAQRGVRSLELGPGCVAEGSEQPTELPSIATEPTPATTVATTTESSTTTTLPDAATVLDILLDDPQFSVLADALGTVDLDVQLGVDDPLTMFAPTDEAFAALGPNFNAALASDPEALAAVLRHHVAAANLRSDELTDGPIVMVDDSTVRIDTSSGLQIVSGDITATVVDPDLDAANGTVHAIDQVLLPADLDIGVAAEEFSVLARYDEGRLIFSGSPASDEQRQRLLVAGREQLASENVVDQLVVDAEATITDDDITAMTALVRTLPLSLVVGEAVVGADGIVVSGVSVDAGALAAIEAVASEVGASLNLTERPTVTDAGIAELEARLTTEVAAAPIRFETGQAELAAETAAVLDRIAALAKSVGGVVITIEGHADSDGTTGANLALSQARAEVVREALVVRGAPLSLVALGFGSTRPILVDGVEDMVASRRVEFSVARE